MYITSSTAITPELMATISRLKTIFYALRSLFCWSNSVYCLHNHSSDGHFHQNCNQRRWCHSLIFEQLNNVGSHLWNERLAFIKTGELKHILLCYQISILITDYNHNFPYFPLLSVGPLHFFLQYGAREFSLCLCLLDRYLLRTSYKKVKAVNSKIWT